MEVARPEAEPPKTEHLPIATLLLDARNYRFTEDHKDAGQTELAILLDTEFDLLDLGKSLASNGYFEQEPMVGIPEAAPTVAPGVTPPEPRVVVVEGNRRLASLLLLTNAELRSAVPHREEWNALAAGVQGKFGSVPVVVYPDRDQVLRYLGQRHITGIKKWDTLAKARFLFDLGEKLAAPARVEQIADISGTDPDLVVQLYLTNAVIEQARRSFHLNTSQWEADFSVLQRALTYYPTMGAFVGLKTTKARALGTRPLQSLRNPIPRTHREKFEEVISYIFGLPGRPAVIQESRGLSALNSVLKSEEALALLRSTRDLHAALGLVEGKRARLLSNLQDADKSLRSAHRDIRQFRKDAKAELALMKCAEALNLLLVEVPTARKVLARSK